MREFDSRQNDGTSGSFDKLATMKTDFIIQEGPGQLKPVTPEEVDHPAPSAAMATLLTSNSPLAREKEIQILLSKIGGKLHDFDVAGSELDALRLLLQSQLADATTLRSKSPDTFL